MESAVTLCVCSKFSYQSKTLSKMTLHTRGNITPVLHFPDVGCSFQMETLVIALEHPSELSGSAEHE
jgi:hypothetical protein